MQLDQVIAGFEHTVETQMRVAGPETAEIGTQLLAALRPALRETLMEVVSHAATEVSCQLGGRRVDIRLVDGDPELIVVDERRPDHADHEQEDDEARMTVRIPCNLKELITEAATLTGESINSYVVEALRDSAYREQKGAKRRTTIEV